jgi:hypothetical protein
MFVCLCNQFLITLTTAVLIACSSGFAQAGWVTIKNDTNKTIVVQETVEVNGQVKRGKPINLLPGERLREYLPGPTVKKVEVFEAQNPNKSVWSGSLNCKEDTQTFSVSTTDGKVMVGQVSCPPKK